MRRSSPAAPSWARPAGNGASRWWASMDRARPRRCSRSSRSPCRSSKGSSPAGGRSRAPSLFAGYCNDAEATAAAMRPDGFFRTGDIGRLRADGSFVFETRRGDAIRLGGFLVSPVEIEDTLKRIPAVADAQVVGVELDGRMRCAAFVIPAEGFAPSEAEIVAGAAEIMAAFKVPARVWFLDAFPVTQSANGTKIQRSKLREMAIERLRPSHAA